MKTRITLTMDKELLDWIDSKVAERVFENRSSAVEHLMKEKSWQ